MQVVSNTFCFWPCCLLYARSRTENHSFDISTTTPTTFFCRQQKIIIRTAAHQPANRSIDRSAASRRSSAHLLSCSSRPLFFHDGNNVPTRDFEYSVSSWGGTRRRSNSIPSRNLGRGRIMMKMMMGRHPRPLPIMMILMIGRVTPTVGRRRRRFLIAVVRWSMTRTTSPKHRLP